MKTLETIPVVCGWCRKKLGTKQGMISAKFKGKPSHGICGECSDKFMRDVKQGSSFDELHKITKSAHSKYV